MAGKSHLHDLETGAKRPTVDTARHLDQVLDAGGALAALVDAPVDPDAEADELLARVRASDVGAGTLAHVEAAVDDMASAYPTAAPDDLLPMVRRHLDYVGRLLDGRATLNQRRRLLVAGAWLTVLRATVHVDLEQRGAATAHLEAATDLAGYAEQPEIQAWCLETRAWDVLTHADYRQAVDLSQQAQRIAPRGSSAHFQATAQEARGWARMGYVRQTRIVLDRLDRLVSNLPVPERAEHHYRYDPTKARAYAATTLAWAGDPAAEQVTRAVLAELDPRGDGGDRPRRPASARLDLALAPLATGQPDEASVVAAEAVASGRVVPSNWWRAREVLRRVERTGMAEAAILREAYDAGGRNAARASAEQRRAFGGSRAGSSEAANPRPGRGRSGADRRHHPGGAGPAVASWTALICCRLAVGWRTGGVGGSCRSRCSPIGWASRRVGWTRSSRYEIALERPTVRRPVLPADGLARDVAHVWTTFQHARYPQVADLVPGLLADAQRSHAYDPGAGRAPLVEAYRVTASLLVKLGAPDVAWLAVDRAMVAATGDRVLVAAAVQLGQVLRESGRAMLAKSAMLAAAYRIAPPVIEYGTPAELSLCGTLLAQAAFAAASDGDDRTAAELIDEAADMAARVGDGHDHHRTGFGPTAVELARVAAAVELGDAGKAVAWHEKVTTRDGWRWLPVEHRAAYLLDVARACLHAGDPVSAGRVLMETDRIAPAEIRHRPAGRDILAHAACDPAAPTTLIQLATNLGVG